MQQDHSWCHSNLWCSWKKEISTRNNDIYKTPMLITLHHLNTQTMPGIRLIENLQCFRCLWEYLFALANDITGVRPDSMGQKLILKVPFDLNSSMAISAANTVLVYYIVFENWSGQANGLSPLQIKTKIIFVTVLVRTNHSNGSDISQML